MKELLLSNRMVALVDDDDYDWLNQYKWTGVKRCKTYYARMVKRHSGQPYMHRFILGIKERDLVTDHRYHNGLNNQRNNLRISTSSQNNANKVKKINSTSKYKGVYLCKQTNRWRATIQKNNISIKLGRFINEEDAAIAYNNAAIEIHGEFALINQILT